VNAVLYRKVAHSSTFQFCLQQALGPAVAIRFPIRQIEIRPFRLTELFPCCYLLDSAPVFDKIFLSFPTVLRLILFDWFLSVRFPSDIFAISVASNLLSKMAQVQILKVLLRAVQQLRDYKFENDANKRRAMLITREASNRLQQPFDKLLITIDY
jgi:hypothetical protein